LESMACGTPVVATDVADNSKIITEGACGHVVGLNDDDKMAGFAIGILRDRELRSRMGAAARARAATEYSLDRLARRTEAAYRDAIRLGGRREVGSVESVGSKDSVGPVESVESEVS
jgi:L-malate glycosyltransferase